MAEQDLIPEADALEQARPLDEGDEEIDLVAVHLGAEVPEADALEQARPLLDPPPVAPRLRADIPEADALEQTLPAGEDDDDWR
jgi:hypothetical protein